MKHLRAICLLGIACLALLPCATPAVAATFAMDAATPPSASETAEDARALWNHYLAKVEPTRHKGGTTTPGRILGAGESDAGRLEAFARAWKYRPATYEIHYQNSRDLARTVYGLAIHSRDIEPTVSLARFAAGVQGYHYTMAQICAWLNDIFAGRFKSPSQEELVLVGFLLQDGALQIKNGGFAPAGWVRHVLAAGPGKRRSFAQNLEHERLHVFWDESPAFRTEAERLWRAMSEEKREAARKGLRQYADNPPQILEEWAVREVEARRLSPE